ncbi:MAG: RagB/SusD family nutrient uptake outer membrane protein [Atribacterota bacterium]|nr:RagB/SusD family nutrient uptake outer membrane protein [Atribacterota bacterium]
MNNIFVKNNNFKEANRISSLLKILLILLILVTSSCEDALDKIPLTSYSDAVVWQDESLIDAYIFNTYRVFPIGWNYMSVICDENNRKNNATIDAYNVGGMTPSHGDFYGLWNNVQNNGIDGSGLRGAGYYPAIKRTNLFFANIDNSDIDDAVKNRMIGEMKFLRAYAYFKLSNLYGGVPLVTRTYELNDDFAVARSSYEECMEFVVNELDEAANLLPLTYSTDEIGRITKGAAMAAKARALLYIASPLHNPGNDQSKWQKAEAATKAVIDLGIYELYPDYRESYLETALYNSEIIWNRLFNNQLFYENQIPDLSHQPNGYHGFAHVVPLHNMVQCYEMTSGLLPLDDPDYDPQNPYVNRDPRFYESILYNGAPFQHREVECFLPGGQDSQEGPIATWNASITSYYVRKFLNESIVAPSGSNNGSTPFPHLRYNEVLLNYAEIKYYQGDEATCREYINKIRSRPSVNMPPVTESGEALLERLRNERKVELYMEEHRWFDVRRWKIAPEVLDVDAERMDVWKDPQTGNITYTVQVFQPRDWYEKMWWLPIPQDEIDKNPNLTQNPGY